MKLKAPSLSAGKRAALERTLKWLINLVTDLETRKANLDKLNIALGEVEQRKAQSEKGAALNPDDAMALAAAEVQLSRLTPEVKQSQQSLETEIATAIRQVNVVRSTELRELLFGPLVDQLLNAIAAALSPFFAADRAKQNAQQNVRYDCEPYRQIMFYLNRSTVVASDFDGAKREINTLVSEIEKILAGGTLLEV